MNFPRAFRPSIVLKTISAPARLCGLCIACATALCVLATTSARADDSANESAKEFLKHPGVIFARELADVPGKNLVVVALEFPPKPSEQSKSPQRYIGHRHPGSVYVHVIKGAVRLAIDGQPVQVVHAGESFFEPVGAIHTVAESASTTEPASAIAVLIVPDGAPILTPVEGQTK